MPKNLPELLVDDAREWHNWLASNHATSPGIRLVLARGGSTAVTRLRHSDALPEALAFGWIDGQVARRDDASWTVRFTPRRPRSLWSKRNTEIAERLAAEGRMQPAGLQQVDAAKADGRWQAAYAGPGTAEVPDDLAAALARSPVAREAFASLSSQNRYAILYRLQTARRRDTRARRLAEFVGMLERGETLHPQRTNG